MQELNLTCPLLRALGYEPSEFDLYSNPQCSTEDGDFTRICPRNGAVLVFKLPQYVVGKWGFTPQSRSKTTVSCKVRRLPHLQKNPHLQISYTRAVKFCSPRVPLFQGRCYGGFQVAGEGFEPPTFRLWAWRATTALPRNILVGDEDSILHQRANCP